SVDARSALPCATPTGYSSPGRSASPASRCRVASSSAPRCARLAPPTVPCSSHARSRGCRPRSEQPPDTEGLAMPDRYGFQTIATELDGRILRVTLNRPDRLNALDIVMHEELGELYGKIERDDDVDAVVLTGAGKAFCVGADFSQMEENLARGGYEDGHPGLMTGSARIAPSS